jgi:hypothetical protein
MPVLRSCLALLLPLIFLSPAEAAYIYAEVPPGDWKWSYTLSDGAGKFVIAPTSYWGHATVTIGKSTITTKMSEDEPSEAGEKPPTFSGKINARGKVEGMFYGLLTEEGGREMVGYYHRQHWRPSCVVETLILQEKYRREDVLIFRRGSTELC